MDEERAQASAASSRSLPQNSSSPMVKDGAPNSPRDAASSVCRLSASLFSGVLAAAKAAFASTLSASRIGTSVASSLMSFC